MDLADYQEEDRAERASRPRQWRWLVPWLLLALAAGLAVINWLPRRAAGEDDHATGATDQIAPQVTVEYSQAEPTNQDVVVKLRANEAINLPEGWSYLDPVTQDAISKTYQENTLEQVRVEDLAGNISETAVAVGNIDRERPVLSNLWYSETAPTAENVFVSFAASEEIIAPAGWVYRNNAQRYQRIFSANWSGQVTVRDLAGNTARIWVSVENIDRALSAQTDQP